MAWHPVVMRDGLLDDGARKTAFVTFALVQNLFKQYWPLRFAAIAYMQSSGACFFRVVGFSNQTLATAKKH